MTFESMVENMNINAESEPLVVKVSLGEEIRRTTFSGVAFEALRDVVAKLFGLEAASVVLKYQDEDGDKITMSSDGEFKDALQGAKDKKLLRLFVELKAAPAPAPIPAPVPVAEEAQREDSGAFFPCGRRFGGGPIRGGFRGPFGFGPNRGHHSGPRGFGPHHGPHGGFPHPHPPHHGFPHAHPHPPHHAFPGQDSPASADSSQPEVPHFQPALFAHGTFSPAGEGASGPCGGRGGPYGGPYGGPWAFKAHKHAMKEHMKEHKHYMKGHKHAMKESMKEQKQSCKQQIKLMKENATTPDDFLAIKEFKKQMRDEWKANWKANHPESDNKKDRFVAKHVADVTIPDNSELVAETPVTKTWRLRNVGATAWPANSQLIFISKRGDNLNGPERVPVGPVDVQQEVDVSVTFITPSEPGRYIGYYRMATGEGAKFGQRVWVSFIIPGANPNNNKTCENVPAVPTVHAAHAAHRHSISDIAMD